MKIFRILAIAAGFVIVLGLVAAIALLLFVDPNAYKGEIAKAVQKNYQRILVIEGDLKLSVFPRIGIDIGRTRLSEHASAAPFASINAAHVSVALWPLLQGRLLIDRIRIDGVDARLTRDAAGHTNIDDLLEEPKDDGAMTRADEASKSSVRFDIAGLELSNSRLALQDAMTRTDARLSDVQITTGRVADGVPFALKAAANIEATQPVIKARFDVQTTSLFDTTKKFLALNDVTLHIDGQLFDAQDLKLDIDAAQLARGPDQLTVEKFTLRATGSYRQQAFEARFDAPAFSLNATAAKSAAMNGRLTLNGSDKLELQFDADGLNGNAQAFQVNQLVLNTVVHQAAMTLTGRLASPLKGNLEAQRFELPTVAADLLINGTRNINVHMSGHIETDVRQETLESAWNGRLDGSQLNAKFGMQGFATPALHFDIGIDQIDLDRYLNAAKNTGKEVTITTTAAANPTVTATKAGDFSALNFFHEATTASGNLHIGSLLVKGIKAQALSVTVHAADSRIDLSSITAQLYQGELNGAAHVTAANTFGLQQHLSNIAINLLLKDALGRDALEGRGDVVLDLNGADFGGVSMMKSLDGTMRINLRDGAVKGFNLAQSLRDLQSKLGALQGKAMTAGDNPTQAANSSNKTDFSELSASFHLVNGVAANDDLNMKSPFLRVGGAGQIDLGNERLDYVARATVVNTSGGQEGKDLAQLTDLTIPVHLGGSFAQPTYRIEWSGIASKALERKLKEKLGEKLLGKPGDTKNALGKNQSDQLKDQLKDKLQDKLKGLFGR